MRPTTAATVFSNGRIVDGRRHIENGYLIMEAATIVAVGSGESKRGSSAATVRHVDLAGRTLLPGFIDCHVHLTMDAEAGPTPIASPRDQMVTLLRSAARL
jgi:imidazolonepropionase-like amidohydrolase